MDHNLDMMSDGRGLSAAALAGGVAVAAAAVLATLLYTATGGDLRSVLHLVRGRVAGVATGASGTRSHGHSHGHGHGHGHGD